MPRVFIFRLFALAALQLALAPGAQAVDALLLEAREVTVAGIPIEGAAVRFDILSDRKTRLTVTARNAQLAAPVGRLTDIALVCEVPVIAEPRYGCDAGRFKARGGPTGALDFTLNGEMRTDSGVTRVRGAGQKFAGTVVRFDALLDAQGWQLNARTGTAQVAALRKFATPWFALPADFTTEGEATVDATVAERGAGTVAEVTVKLNKFDFSNAAGDIVGDKVAAVIRARLTPRTADTGLTLEMQSDAGQAVASVVFLDLAKNPLRLALTGILHGNALAFDSLHYAQRDLIDMTGSGRLDLAAEVPVVSGDFKLAKLEFPAAYSSYLASALASSVLGDLATSGSLSGAVSVANNGVTALHVVPRDLTIDDNKGRLHLAKVNGDVAWAAAGAVQMPDSTLSWNTGGAFGLSGGAATLDFRAGGASFTLTRPAKLPVFDGAIAIDTFAMSNMGAPDMEVAFKGRVEPISMRLLAQAFGWPQFEGSLAASVPGVTLKNNVLTFDGNVESSVFGGTLVGSNIRLQDPLGPYPRFLADVRARGLDLGLVTNTFEVGSITGKLDVDVLGLELYGWTLIGFDARLATPAGDKSRHRISAKAVSSLSNVGGGGGGVVQALQSGVLKFFDEYSYDKLGITCRLRSDVCEMSGIEPAGVGYYIVKGAGIPRIDIVGSAGRVRWSQLMSSITTTNFGGASAQ